MPYPLREVQDNLQRCLRNSIKHNEADYTRYDLIFTYHSMLEGDDKSIETLLMDYGV